MKAPLIKGLPDIITVSLSHNPSTPGGNPEKLALVAPVVGNDIKILEPTQTVWFIPCSIVFKDETEMVPEAIPEGQPPVVSTV